MKKKLSSKGKTMVNEIDTDKNDVLLPIYLLADSS